MSSTESNFSFTTKFNGDLLTVRGNTVEEFYENAVKLSQHGDIFQVLTALQGGNVERLLYSGKLTLSHEQAVQTVQENLGGQVISETPAPAQAAVPVPAQGGVRVVQDNWGNAYEYGHADAPSCPHGARVKATKKKRAGGTYQEWACPVSGPEWSGPRSGKCTDKVWVN